MGIEEVPVEVPQIQTAEVLRQDAVAQTREVVKQIPRVNMQYRERVIEMKEQIREEFVAPMVEYAMPAPVAMPTQYAMPTPVVGTLPTVSTVGTVLPSPMATIGTMS